MHACLEDSQHLSWISPTPGLPDVRGHWCPASREAGGFRLFAPSGIAGIPPGASWIFSTARRMWRMWRLNKDVVFVTGSDTSPNRQRIRDGLPQLTRARVRISPAPRRLLSNLTLQWLSRALHLDLTRNQPMPASRYGTNLARGRTWSSHQPLIYVWSSHSCTPLLRALFEFRA